jgi:signal transduction histidine kinase
MKLFITALLVVIIQVGDIFTWGIVLLVFPDAIRGEVTLNPNFIFVFGATVSYLYAGLAVLIFHFFPLRQYGNMTKKQGFLLVAMPLFSYAAIALLYRYFQVQQSDEFYIYLLLSLFFIALLLFIVLFFRNMQRSQENVRVSAVLNSQLEHFSAQYEALDSSMRLFRERSHDWKNHLLVLKALSDSGDAAEIREYISGLSHGDEFVSATYTGNPAVDIIFNVLSVKSTRAGIDINITARLAHDIAINTADICVVISNAVDNAFEACERISDGARRINIEIVTDKTYLFFTVSNTIQELPKRQSGRFLTSKADSTMHGIGLQSIERIVNKHSGHFNITLEGDVFILSCALRNEKITD